MPNHRRAFAIIAISAVLALTGGVTLALTTLRTAEAIASAQEADCPLLTAPTDDPTLVGITQARLEAQRTFVLYEFDGVSDEPRIVGHLDPGEQFCLSESDLDWGVTITEGNSKAPIGIIHTADHPEGVYSGAVGTIPSLPGAGTDGDAAQRIIPLRIGHGWIQRPADTPTLPASAVLAVTLGQAGKSGAVSGLSASDVLGLH